MINTISILQKLSILTEIWKNIHQDIGDHSDLVEAMNDENLEGNLWSFENEMTSLEEQLMTFLNTRKFAFPKFALCSTPKVKAIFCYRNVDNFNKWVSLMFPHVQCLIMRKDQGIIGYTTKAGFSRHFAQAISFDWTADFIACKLQEAIRATFKDEIAQNMITGVPKRSQQQKQETKYLVLPMHTTFVIRNLAFVSEYQRYFSDPPLTQKQHVLEMLVQQNNRVASVAAMLQDSKTEDTTKKCNDVMGIEVAIKQVIEKYVEMVFDKDLSDAEKQEEIKSKWTGMLKFTIASKDPLDIIVSVLDKQLMFGFDETADCQALNLIAFRDEPLGYIGKLLVHNFGSVLDGKHFSGRFQVMQCFSQVLGRHLIPIAYFNYSKLDDLEDLLYNLEATQDFICFHNIESEDIYNSLFTVILAYHMKIKEYKSVIFNKMSVNTEKFPVRIFFQSSFPPNDLLYVGKEYRVVAVNNVNLTQVAQFALLAENFVVTLKLIQLLVISLTVVKHQVKHHLHFTVKDIRTILKSAKGKINTKNASDDEAVIGALLEAYPVNKKLIINLFKQSVNTSSIERLVETQLLDEQIAYCQRNQIQLTPNFKSMLHNVTYSLLGQNNLLFYGDPVSNKTTLWKTATACFDFEIAVVSNLALEPSGDGKYEMKHIKILEKDHNEPVKDLLLVLEGDLDKTIDSTLLALLQYDTFLLKDNGQLAVRDRNMRIILEAGSNISEISPALASFFHFHKCDNIDISWKMTLQSKIYSLTQKSEFLSSMHGVISKASEDYVEVFFKIRDSLDMANDKVTQDSQMNSLIGFFSSIIGSDVTLDTNDLQQMMIYACIFCFTQDVPIETRKHMEIKIREVYECRLIPTELSIFDYYYDPKSKLWKALKNHPLCNKGPSKGPVMLKNHLKQEIIARIMVKNLVSVDIQADGGVGRSTMLRNLLDTFSTMDFLGVALPSCTGTKLSKITNSMFKCIQEESTGMYSKFRSTTTCKFFWNESHD